MSEPIQQPLRSVAVGGVSQPDRVAPAADQTDLVALFALHAPDSPMTERLRRIKSNLLRQERQAGHEHKLLVVTSPQANDGKTLLTANLGIVLARPAGTRVLIVDLDLRKPKVHRVFGHAPRRGVRAILDGQATLEEMLVPGPVPGIDLLLAGRADRSTIELTSAELEPLFREARQRYDRVIVDTPPVLQFSDAVEAATIADGTILVARARRTLCRAVQRSLESLEGCRMLGMVLNDTQRNLLERRYYGYSYKYKYRDK
ncbi:MAG: CpsD/CapB family tyrosine-protein kinase [Acidobacteria bacterium]|nr:CpsD/CapB family tyrosine-protein kinase [Acidobacteriota bacterium]